MLTLLSWAGAVILFVVFGCVFEYGRFLGRELVKAIKADRKRTRIVPVVDADFEDPVVERERAIIDEAMHERRGRRWLA